MAQANCDHTTDPIYAAIARHEACYVALELLPDGPQESSAADRLEEDAVNAETSAGREMAATVPTTLPGLLALLRYVEKYKGWDQILDEASLLGLVSTTISALDGIGAVS